MCGCGLEVVDGVRDREGGVGDVVDAWWRGEGGEVLGELGGAVGFAGAGVAGYDYELCVLESRAVIGAGEHTGMVIMFVLLFWWRDWRLTVAVGGEYFLVLVGFALAIRSDKLRTIWEYHWQGTVTTRHVRIYMASTSLNVGIILKMSY